MRYPRAFIALVMIAGFAIPAFVPAAPRLEPKPSFELADVEAYCVLIGPSEVANTEMKATFSIRGKFGETYTVDLYVEADNTGEKATLLRSTNVKIDRRVAEGWGVGDGEFKVRYRLPGEPADRAQPPLPFRMGDRDWTYILVIRIGDNVVATLGPQLAPFIRKQVHVAE